MTNLTRAEMTELMFLADALVCIPEYQHREVCCVANDGASRAVRREIGLVLAKRTSNFMQAAMEAARRIRGKLDD